MRYLLHVLALLTVLAVPGVAAAGAQEPGAGPAAQAALRIPSSLHAEHQQLHASLAAAISAGGHTGEAARALEKLLAPHFQKEEQFAMPLLGLLNALTSGQRPADLAGAVAMGERLRRELPGMLREHAAIASAVERLRAAALEEGRHDAAGFAATLASHARQEEQIHYPAALLVSEFLKAKP